MNSNEKGRIEWIGRDREVWTREAKSRVERSRVERGRVEERNGE